jgi:outer membrane protein assembly factor BamE (lipoprotein component of BamABCDE complex)
MTRASRLLPKVRRGVSGAVLTCGILVASACTPQLDMHGDHLDADRLAQVRPGVQNRDAVAQMLGSPSSTSVFDDESWYYIGDVVERRSIFDREVTERQVVTIRFDKRGIVREVDLFGLERGREVEVVERETPSFGESLNFLDQIVGNLGRFNRETQQRR